MNHERTANCADRSDIETPTQIVHVLMSENDDGVAGIVCATRQRAEDELREILTEYIANDANGPVPTLSEDAIESLIQEMRQTSINPSRDDRYWIDECPVHR